MKHIPGAVTVYDPTKRHKNQKHNPQDLLRYIVRYKTAHDGNSPTLREIMAACGISSMGTTRGILRRLVRDGFIRLPGRRDARAIEVIGGRWVYGESTR